MSNVTVYQSSLYDIVTDTNRKSRRWATREAIESVRGHVIEHTATEVDASVVASDIQGMSVKDFDPHARSGFQRNVI